MPRFVVGTAAGIAIAVIARQLLIAALTARLRHGVARLAQGDAGTLLAGYHENAVLHFHEGEHRWSGEYRGRDEIGRFLQDFVDAGIVGEIKNIWIGGPPWALTITIRFDDHATLAGETIYVNRTVLWARTRWGKIVEQRDFYEDTQRLVYLDRRLPA